MPRVSSTGSPPAASTADPPDTSPPQAGGAGAVDSANPGAPSTSSSTNTGPDVAATFDPSTPSAPAADAPSPLNGGLPAVLLDRAGGGRVVHGDDPGDFYCEHMFYSAQQAAASTPSVLSNASGERLVGFLHCPWDAHTSRSPDLGGYTLDQRHGRTREVVGAALRGFFNDAQAGVQGPVRLLLTGYDQFGTARNNPTGEFVTAQENLDAAMAEAFGSDLQTSTGKRFPSDPNDPPDVMTFLYAVKTPGGDRQVELRAQRFPVDDRAIDAAQATSIQASMTIFSPHAVLSMGVAPGNDYRAEFHADDGGMVSVAGTQRHDGSAPPRNNLGDNYALARAITNGAAGPVQSTLSVRTDPIV